MRSLLVMGLTTAVTSVGLISTGPAASADTAPVAPVTVPTVSADALPTVQIGQGVVWDQLIVGNRVYVTGEFSTARPAGSPLGSNETPRANILAYDLTTGALITSWAPTLNGAGRTLAASADGTRIFVGGSFTQVSGVNRYRLAALDATTGALITSWSPGTGARVSDIAVSGDTVYFSGIFTTVGSFARTRLAAVSATTGAVLEWAPTADAEPLSLVAPAGSGKVVIGGKFANLNGAPAYGMAAVDATTGATVPWAATSTVRNAGTNAAVYSLSTDGTQVYGTGYTFGSGGNFEGTFAARSSDGGLEYVTSCRGDTYDSTPIGDVLYSVGHSHDCIAIDGLPQTTPTWTFQRANAQTIKRAPSGLLNGSGTFVSQPAPELLHWTPVLDVGSYTGADQAAWTVEGNQQYVLLGGEFPRVNGRAQQGLVRFAVRSAAPNAEGPEGGSQLDPTFTELEPGTLRLSWTGAYDADNRHLTYQVLRGSSLASAQVIATLTRDNAWWNRPGMSFVDTTAAPGSTQTYRIRVRDDIGNVVTGDPETATIPAGAPASAKYATAVRSDGATNHWRLGETSGTVAHNWTGSDQLNLASTATRNQAGALTGDTNPATRFAGSGSLPGTTTVSRPAPQNVTVEAWFKTSSTRGGKIVGYGSSSTGNSSTYDRHLYLSNSGQVVFGTYVGSTQATVTSPSGLNNNQWHHVAGSVGPAGVQLFVDGALVGTNTTLKSGATYLGFWRVGGDNLGSWPSRPSSTALDGFIDEVAVYQTQLPAAALLNHFQLGQGTLVNKVPTASFTATSTGLTAAFDASASADEDGTVTGYAWDFGDGTTGTGVTASHAYPDTAASYTVTLTVTDDAGATGTTTRTVAITPPANTPPTASFTSTAVGLDAAFNAGGSTDADGTIASYAWDFGDGATGTGATATHTYAAAGTFTVTLTVTDNRGATGTSTAPLTVTVPGAGDVVAKDTFERTVASGFGSAETGGPWTVSASGSTLSVTGGAGQMSVPAGRTAVARLAGVSNQDTDLTFAASTDVPVTGGGVYVSGIGRATSTGDYRVRVRIQTTGQVTAGISSVVGGTETFLASQVNVSGVTYTTGAKLMVRLQVSGTSPTQIRYRVWLAGGTEPSTWLQTVTSSTDGLQAAGGLGLVTYTSSSSTQAAVMRFDDLSAVRL